MSHLKYNPHNPNKEKIQNINSDQFYDWSKRHFYRTNNNDMDIKKNQQEPKSMQIPGYLGFIPGKDSDDTYGKRFPQITKDLYLKKSQDSNPYSLSTTGANLKSHYLIDKTKQQFSHKYGKSNIILNHPCLNGSKWESQEKSEYKSPNSLLNPCFRETDKNLVNNRFKSQLSGFLSNINMGDGYGVKPQYGEDGSRQQTCYRLIFNQEKPVHRNTTMLNLRKKKI